MPLRREPPTLYAFTKAALTSDITFRVRVMLQRGLSVNRTLDHLDKVISSLPPSLATDLAQTALRCADLFCERSALSPSVLHPLVRVLIHDSTIAFQITTLDTYQVRQAVLNRLCDLRHLQVYYNLQYFHENFNISSTLQRLQSLSNLRHIYLSQWCSDEIAHLLGKSCPNLRLLDARSSLSLTDSSVPSLRLCQRLKVLLIHSTSISDTGYEELLENLPLLQRIGPCDRLSSIIGKIRGNRGCFLSLREYESCEIPDENVTSTCPYLTSVHLYGTHPWKEPRLSHQITHLKLQSNNSKHLDQLLTSSLVHLDLLEYPLTEESMTAIANVCGGLRTLRLNQLANPLRLVTTKNDAFSNLKELEVPDSALALDILLSSSRIRQLLIQPQKISPFSLQSFSPFWTDAVLNRIIAEDSLQFLESLYLSTRCDFSVNTLFNFLQACPRLRSLGNIHTWGRAWETELFQMHSLLQKHNLAVDLIL